MGRMGVPLYRTAQGGLTCGPAYLGRSALLWISGARPGSSPPRASFPRP